MNNPLQRQDRLGLGGILLLALLVRLYGLTGDMLYDPIVYAQNAYNILQGTFTLETTSWFAHRVTVFLPVAPLYAIFGVGSLTSRIWPLAASLIQLSLLFWVGVRLFGRPTAYLAAFFVALAPLDILYSGVLNPDIVIATFMTGAAVFWILAIEEKDRSARLFLLLSGLSFGLALVTRPFAVILILFYAITWLWRRPRWMGPGWVILGALLVAVPLGLTYFAETGDLLYRLGVVTGRYGAGAKAEGARLLFYPGLLVHLRHTMTGLAPALFALGLLGTILRPDRTRILLLLWAVPILLYLQFGSMSLSEYIPILKRERFLLPLSVPLALLSASVILQMLGGLASVLRSQSAQRWGKRVGILAILAGILVYTAGGLLIVRDHRDRGRETYAAFRESVRVLREEPAIPILFDHWRTGYRFSYYFEFEEGADFYRGGDDADRFREPGGFGESRFGYLAWYPDPDQIPAAYVLLDQTVLRAIQEEESVTRTYRSGDVPAYVYDIPPEWEERGAFGPFRIYRTPSN